VTAGGATSSRIGVVPASAIEVFKEMLRDHVAPGLRAAGFVGSGTSFVLPSEEHWAMVGFQGSTSNTRERMKFTVNCKVVRKDVWAQAHAEHPYLGPKPKPNVHANVEWWERVGRLMPEGNDHWWWIELGQDPAGVARDMLDSVARYAVPAMRAQVAQTG
jgi:hypothetical protein